MVVTLRDEVKAQCAIAWNEGRGSQWKEHGAAASSGAQSFAAVGVPGLLGPQKPYRQQMLFEVLDIPEPHFLDLYVTIGVKSVDSMGQESSYTVQEMVIEAT
jgi:hypothetical protein